MKKLFVFALILFVITIAIFLKFDKYNTITTESKIEKLLTTAYTSDYNDYSNDNKFDIFDKIKEEKENEVKHLFTERGFDFIRRIGYMASSGLTSIRHKCSLEVYSVEIDLRETEDEDIKVCYYTVLVRVDYFEGDLTNENIEITGTISIYHEEEEWRIGTIIEDGYPFDDLLENSNN